MYLIATDEAGYGPKLGPLVIAATVWRLPGHSLSQDELHLRCSQLASPTRIDRLSLSIDDSKRIFRQGHGLQVLETIVLAGLRWCGFESNAFPELLSYLCADDVEAIAKTPWLCAGNSIAMDEPQVTGALIDHWSDSGITMVSAHARVIPARMLNQAFQDGFNKADLLSHTTLSLVNGLLSQLPSPESQVMVYCDRHGGRRYYAGPLLHHFSQWALQVLAETPEHSRYRLTFEKTELDVHFTVKGDRFPPVAFSSLIAKYLRERFMESFNEFFASRYRDPNPLRPTAGYPVDADRFLRQVAQIRQQADIDDFDLIRTR